MIESSLSEMLASMEQRRGRWHVALGENWLQGRTTFGGMGAALAVGAARHLVDTEKPLRSLMTNFVGPLEAGAVSVSTELLREGRSAAQVEARVWSGEKLATTVSAVFGSARNEISVPAQARPFESSPDDYRADGEIAGRRPEFLKNFDVRWKGNGIPWSGARDRHLEMWVRHREDMSSFPLEKIITLADIPPGAILSWFDRPAMLSSLTWILDLLKPAGDIHGDWFYLDYELLAARDGYSHQSGRIYDETGELVAVSHQCMVYFEPQQD